MKKLMLFFVAFFVLTTSIQSFGQLQKGSILLGTTVSVSTNNLSILTGAPNHVGIFIGKATSKFGSNEYTEDIRIINFSPQMGYFVADNLVAGITLKVFNYNTKDEDNDEFTFNSFYGGPFVRYYIDIEKAHPYIFGGAEFGKAKSSYSGSSDDDKTSILNLGGGIGIAIFLNKSISFDAALGYNFMKLEDDDSTFNSEDTLGNIGFDIGFTYVLGVNNRDDD